MSRARVRFLAWYRVVPLLAIALMGVVASVYSYAPALLFSTIYPLHYEDEIASVFDSLEVAGLSVGKFRV